MTPKLNPMTVHLDKPPLEGDRMIRLLLPPGSRSLLIESPDGKQYLAVGIGDALAGLLREKELAFRAEMDAQAALKRGRGANGRATIPLKG